MSVTLSIESKVATITMDDGKANAVGFTLIDALNSALDEAEAKVNAIVLTGREGKFSAGFDLNVLREGSPADAARLVNQGGALALRLFQTPLPVITGCNGHAIAMGCFLMLATDIRIGTLGAFKIGANETAIGMTLPVFAAELLKARIQPHQLTEVAITGQLFGPTDAVSRGFLDQAVAPEQMLPLALAEAERLGALPRAAYAGNKMLIRKPFIDAIAPTISTQ